MKPKTIHIEDTPGSNLQIPRFNLHTDGFAKGDLSDILHTLKKAVAAIEYQMKQPARPMGTPQVVQLNVDPSELVASIINPTRRT